MTLLELLQKYRVPYKMHGEHNHATSGWCQVDCPSCTPNSGRFRLGLPLHVRNVCNCWSCGVRPFLLTLAKLTGESFDVLRGLLGTPSPHDVVWRPRGILKWPDGVGPLQMIHRDYLQERGINAAYAANVWGVRGIGVSSRWQWRLLLPVTLNGRSVSWTTRTVGINEPRYLSAPPDMEEEPHKALLYGADLARHTAIVCEGPMDALRIGPGAIATFGVTVSKAQLAKLSKYPTRVICFDADADGYKAAEQLCDQLQAFEGRTVNVHLDSGKDAGEASDREIRQLRAHFLGD